MLSVILSTDTVAERAVEENDAIGLEQAREWAAEQSLRMNQTRKKIHRSSILFVAKWKVDLST